MRIHLKSRQGIYTVVSSNKTHIVITCHRWNALANHPKEQVTKTVSINDYKCLVGAPGDKKRRAEAKSIIQEILILQAIASD